MDTELAMNWFSEQFCGRLLEGLQDEDQSLPNIPIADLGDLDISIPPPQNGGLHWTNNNNNNNEVLAETGNPWVDVKPQADTGKRQLDYSPGDMINDGHRGTKYLRTLLASDVTTGNRSSADKLETADRGTNNLAQFGSFSERHDSEFNAVNAPGDANVMTDPPPTMGSFHDGYGSSVPTRRSADLPGFHDNGHFTDKEGSQPKRSSESKMTGNDNLDTYQQVHMSPATTQSSRTDECDSVPNLLSPVTEPTDYPVLHLPADPGGTTESSRPDSPPPPHGQSINVIKVDPPANLHQQPEHSEENTKTQAFLDWAMETLLKSADTFLELHNEKTDNNSSPSSRGPVKGASDQGDTPGSDMQQHVLKGQQSAKDKESSSVQSSENQIENISSPPFHVQRCVLCLLCFKDSEDFLAHLKQSHSDTDYFQCPQCAAKLDDLELLGDHMKVHSLISNISTDDDAQLETTAVHISCDICRALFSSKETLQEHHSTSHNEEDNAQSEDCNQSSQTHLSNEPKDAHKLTTTDAIDTIEVPSSNETTDVSDIVADHGLQQQEESHVNGHNSPTQLKPVDSPDVYSEQNLHPNPEADCAEESATEEDERKYDTFKERNGQNLNSTFTDGLIAFSQNLDHNIHLNNVSEQGHVNSSRSTSPPQDYDDSKGTLPQSGQSDIFQAENSSKLFSDGEATVENKDLSSALHQHAETNGFCVDSAAENSEDCSRGVEDNSGITPQESDLIAYQNGDSLSDNLGSAKHDNSARRSVLSCHTNVTDAVSPVTSSSLPPCSQENEAAAFTATVQSDNQHVTLTDVRNTCKSPESVEITLEMPNVAHSFIEVAKISNTEENSTITAEAPISTVLSAGGTTDIPSSPAHVLPVECPVHVNSLEDVTDVLQGTDDNPGEANLLVSSNVKRSPIVPSNIVANSKSEVDKENTADEVTATTSLPNFVNNSIEANTHGKKLSDVDGSFVQSSKNCEEVSLTVQSWIRLTESNSVIPPHMPNYTTYKCPNCEISFMTQDVLTKHLEAHRRSKKRMKKKSKGKRRKSKKTDRTSKDTDIGKGHKETEASAIDIVKNNQDDVRSRDLVSNQNQKPVIVSYTESDQEDEDNILKDNEIEDPLVVNNSLWSKHVQLFQEYL